ncbi:leucine-rich repeat-containing protein 15 [Schistocerca serialis cubense]|uniref:leucine-rich repeat-containing protein 15 n=1 Tax=Schistocerca serialis cubense TaxID=2023355 RepID=UPI00214EEDF7|nr:leucine-rich repeat-containing protein 15 [Schistocerca serialis cubense]
MRSRLAERTVAAAPPLLLLLLALVVPTEAYSCPSECSCHPPDGARVDCSSQSLTAIPEGLDPNVTYLDLSRNNIMTVDPAKLSGLTRLTRLDLSGNYISLLSAAAFSALVSLEELDLSGNRISRLAHVAADSLLANLTRLGRLSLAGNQLRELQELDGALVLASPSLRELDLSRCQLQKIDHRATLARLPRLQVLNVSDNPIKWIREVVSASLHTLDASRCEMDSLGSSALRGLTALVSLRVSLNPQLRLGEPRLYAATLRRLHADHCALDKPALQGMPALQYAFLRGNKVETLTQKDFNNSAQLIRLELPRNLIRFIEKDAFRPLVELERLDLSGNKLHQLAWNAFVNCKKLKWLYLSENPLTELTNISSDSIRTIDASQCKISGLRRDVLTGARQLLELNLSSNWIESVPKRLRSVSLVKLDLSQCRLSAVTNETFVELYQLRYLYLHGNRLTNVPKSSMVTGLKNLVHLTLHDNPWRCDCGAPDFRYLWDNLTASSPPILTVSERQTVKCASPEAVAGQQWWLACVEKWYPPAQSQATNTMSRNGAAALGLVAVIVTAVALFCFLRQRLHEKKEERAREVDRMARAADEVQDRLRRQHSEAMLHQELEAIARSRSHLSSPPRQRRTESQLTEPPTYEEALLMARSVEELAERNAAAVQAQTMTHAPRRPSSSSSSGSSGDSLNLSGDDDGQYARAAGWSEPSGRRHREDSEGSLSAGDNAGDVYRHSEDPSAKRGPIPGSPGSSSSSSAHSFVATAGTSSDDEAKATRSSAAGALNHRRS